MSHEKPSFNPDIVSTEEIETSDGLGLLISSADRVAVQLKNDPAEVVARFVTDEVTLYTGTALIKNGDDIIAHTHEQPEGVMLSVQFDKPGFYYSEAKGAPPLPIEPTDTRLGLHVTSRANGRSAEVWGCVVYTREKPVKFYDTAGQLVGFAKPPTVQLDHGTSEIPLDPTTGARLYEYRDLP